MRRLIIAGIDPGTTTGYALLDISGNLVDAGSSKSYSLGILLSKITSAGKIIPISLAPQALKIGLNHEANAQLLLIKVENGHDLDNYLIKYFFRKDLTTKKYFYVTIDSKNESEIKTNAVYVNPDNDIPSLNDQVLGNKLGIDFEEARKIATDLCSKTYPDQNCKELPASAQFIQSGNINIWH